MLATDDFVKHLPFHTVCRKLSRHGVFKKLYYIHDPMCSWCWAFRPTWSGVIAGLPSDLTVVRVLGGLAPETDEPMSMQMREWLQTTWRRILYCVPGTQFNFAFWERCVPRRSTYPACRAVIAAREQGPNYDDAMTLAIQQAYYLLARNPSERVTLVELASEIGLDKDKFSVSLDNPETARMLAQEIEFARFIGVRAFPSLILANKDNYWSVPIHYTNPQAMLDKIVGLLKMDF